MRLEKEREKERERERETERGGRCNGYFEKGWFAYEKSVGDGSTMELLCVLLMEKFELFCSFSHSGFLAMDSMTYGIAPSWLT